ncbi:iron complex transport system permease protein [Micromonospora citrea]|uniref:Iron complex transport system permease protein n=1 Tax=Micromonospora citrea TaxID=47855 RepID=A0A1C6VY43_9ACTN|nr:iron ABC transporter permease [Micromonospora citrea]SCL71245.1 iron complex transport system permease protein [Micromonospora citrea]
MRWWWAVAALLVAATAELAVGRGVDWPQLDAVEQRILVELRLPRLVTALLAGAGLGAAGLLMQAVLRNPLAAPELTGVNPGAVLGVLAGIQVGLVPADSAPGALVAALTGGTLGGTLMWLLARRRAPAEVAAYGLLGSAALAGVTTLLLAYEPSRFGNALRWLVGTVEGRVWAHVQTAWPWLAAALVVAWLCSAALGVLAAGDGHAAALGLAPRRARAVGIALAVALAAGAVALAGALAFVGLVVPHVARAMCGADLRRAVPAAALLGATAVVGADVLAQVLTVAVQSGSAGQRLGVPAGAVTALLGAVALVVVARRSSHVEVS